jgi:uncharacterized protein YcnI
MKTLSMVLISCMLSMIFVAGIASAHVTVLPKDTTQGSYEVITVRVPSEKDVPTVKIEVEIPEGIEITRFEPKPEWNYKLTQDVSGKITSVIWTAEGNGLSSTEFSDFKMQGKIGSQSSQIVWKAYQFYQDGSKVDWTGAPESDTPAPVMQVKPKGTGLQGEIGGNMANVEEKQGFILSLSVSIAALIVGLVSFRLSIRKKSNL